MTDTIQPEVASQKEPAPAKKRRTRSEIARASLARSKDSERKVASYLRVVGFPGAERTVRTGYKNHARHLPDYGDIDGTPGVAWQIKDTTDREWWRVPNWLAETNAQRLAAQADVGVLVVRRPGHGHPGQWWAWMWLGPFLNLTMGSDSHWEPEPGEGELWDAPIRMELRHVVPVLRVAGYGTQLEAAS
jgi:hypothetical protein